MNDTKPLEPFENPSVPMPREGILPGMKFQENHYVLRLQQAGNVRVIEVHDTYVVGEYYVDTTYTQKLRTKRPRRKFWKLDNGLLVRFKLDPSPDGYGCSEPGLYTPGGPVTITGRYPVYFTDAGDRVWIMADGSFVESEPEFDIVRQLRSKHGRVLMESKKRVSLRDAFSNIFTCDNCGETLGRSRSTKRFCSDYCRRVDHVRKKRNGL